METYVVGFFKELEIYEDVYKKKSYKEDIVTSVTQFLTKKNERSAYEVYNSFFKAYWVGIQHNTNPFLKLTQFMEEYEKNAGKLIDKQRDHYSHSVYVFLLGICIYYQNCKFRNCFDNYALNGKKYKDFYRTRHEEELPDFNNFVKLPYLSPNKKFQQEYYKKYSFLKHKRKRNALTLLSEIIAEIYEDGSQRIRRSLENFLSSMKKEGFIDHGLYGAIVMLRWYYYLIKSTNWNPAYFYFPVRDAAKAILLHNLYKYVYFKKPFNFGKLSAKKDPITYLLILADELQDWGRKIYSKTRNKADMPIDVNLNISNKHMSLKYIYKNKNSKKGVHEKKCEIGKYIKIGEIFSEGIKF